MIWHYDRGVQYETGPVIVEAVLENGVSRVGWEGIPIVFAECDEQSASCFLVVRELAAVFVLAVEVHGDGH